MLQRETTRVYLSKGVAIQFARFESSGLQHQDRVYRSRIHDVKELKVRLLSLREWRLLDHTIIVAVIAQWRSRLNACVRVNGGHFEHKF